MTSSQTSDESYQDREVNGISQNHNGNSSTDNSDTRSLEPSPAGNAEVQDPRTTNPGRHSHHQHNAIARNQPTAPAQLRVYRLQRNVQPLQPLAPVQNRQNPVREEQPSTSQPGQQEQNVVGEVSPALVQRENQSSSLVQHSPPQLGRIRSGRSQVHSFVRFVNQTLRNVNILWLNYEGARVRYKTLYPNQFVDVNTFVGHPWIFRDADTGDKLVVQLREVYEPIGYNVMEGWPPHRRVVKISIPVYSLQERCMQVVRDLVPPDKVDQLEIPLFLRQVIQQLIGTKSSSINSPMFQRHIVR